MKHPFQSKLLPAFTLISGVLGLGLQYWLFSSVDEKGLLPVRHPANILLYALTALVLTVVFLASRNLQPTAAGRSTIRFFGVTAYILGGLSLIFSAYTNFTGIHVKMAGAAALLCLAGALAMFFMAILKGLCKKLPYWLCAILTLTLMVNSVACCQIWGVIPQLQEYFFPLLASVFLILTAYHKTALCAGEAKRKQLLFFSQGSVFFCCLSLISDRWPMYLGMLFWAAVQFFPCTRFKKEA